jgi:hypothetical protein
MQSSHVQKALAFSFHFIQACPVDLTIPKGFGSIHRVWQKPVYGLPASWVAPLSRAGPVRSIHWRRLSREA